MNLTFLLVLFIFAGFYCFNMQFNQSKKLKIDLDDVTLTLGECNSLCSIDEAECLISPYYNKISKKLCPNQSLVCQNACKSMLRPDTKFLFNYSYITDKQQAMRKYLCDSNVIMCLKTTKDVNKCLNEQRQCYEKLEPQLKG